MANSLSLNLADFGDFKASVVDLTPGDTVEATVSLTVDSIDGDNASFSVSSLNASNTEEVPEPEIGVEEAVAVDAEAGGTGEGPTPAEVVFGG